MKKLSTEEFILRSELIHGCAYDYSKVAYTSSTKKVEIVCKVHGSFFQNASSHLAGRGCAACSRQLKADARRSSTEQIVARFTEIHGDRYDYGAVKFQDHFTNVEIVCSEHGSFLQRPAIHLRGSGCPACGLSKGASNSYKTTAYFIDKARSVHGDSYDYSETVYSGATKKVSITCAEHG